MMLPSVNITCGPDHDRRQFKFQLPFLKRKIGVLVSGGLDSALLYYFVRSLAMSYHKIQPFVITRNDGSNVYAQQVIDHIHEILNLPPIKGTVVHISEKDSDMQVTVGIETIRKTYDINMLYVGLIQVLPQHALGGVKIFSNPTNTDWKTYPLKDLNKSHIIDLVVMHNLQNLFKITHSCVYPIGRCNVCNRCLERQWAFEQFDFVDLGKN